MRLGIFGGSFDPVHLGHLILAETAREQLGLDGLRFLPAARSPHKPDAAPTADAHRVAMLELALAAQPAFALERLDLERPAPSYTVDSLGLLRARLGAEVELWWILGSDSLASFPRWRQPERILELARLAVFDRPGPPPDLAALERALPGLAGRLDRLEGPRIEISATDIRQRVRQGRSIRFRVPEPVEAYIRRHRLYREPAAAPARLLLATGNAGKLREYRALLADLPLRLLAPADLGLEALDPEETGDSFEANAILKARAFAAAAGLPALADDSGIEVDALGGFPGIRSARWVAGSDADRVQALLDRLAAVPDPERGARFRAVVALAWPDGRVVTAAGQVAGRIAWAPAGAGGFGYDPIFRVEDGGHQGELTSAELPPDEKNRLSHRARALQGLQGSLRALAGAEPA